MRVRRCDRIALHIYLEDYGCKHQYQGGAAVLIAALPSTIHDARTAHSGGATAARVLAYPGVCALLSRRGVVRAAPVAALPYTAARSRLSAAGADATHGHDVL
eukprot:IDg1179t1